MALEATSNTDLASLLTGGNYPNDGGDLAEQVNDATSNQSVSDMVYYDRLDLFIANWDPNTTLDPSIEHIRLDPLFQSNLGTFGATDEPGTIGGDAVDSKVVGEWDRTNNIQKLYVYRAGTGSGFHEVNPLALNLELASNVFPNFGPVGSQGSAPGSGVVGHVDQVDGGFIIFETWGFAVCVCCRVVDVDTNARDRVMALVDLSTGAATIVPSPVAYGTVGHAFGEAQLFAQDVEFQFGQFVPDLDLSTPAAPRGELHLTAPGGGLPSDPSNFQRTWIKVIDWNPLGVAGTPNRIHLRERLLTAIDLDKNNPSALNGVHPSTNENYRTFYHPRTRRRFLVSGDGASDPLVAGEQKIMFLSSSPAVSEIVVPSAQSDVATGRITKFFAEALGTLEEKIAGVNLQAVLLRESTVDEVLAVTPSAGETVSVAQTINPTDPNVSPVVVKKDAAALTESVHYTVNRATSEITFIGPEPVGGSTYTATYRHFDDPVAPPHGTLLNQFSRTDQDGRALFEVDKSEEDPVDDRWDSLDVTQV